jgi:rubrerythrin
MASTYRDVYLDRIKSGKAKPTLRSLLADEHKAISDYSEAITNSKPEDAQMLRHIRGEEQGHAKELKTLIDKE